MSLRNSYLSLNLSISALSVSALFFSNDVFIMFRVAAILLVLILNLKLLQ